MTTWLLLFAAIIFEVIGTTMMKLSAGFTRLIPSLMIFVCYGTAFGFLTLCLRKMEVSTAYAIWSGLGTALIALIGAAFFNEQLTLMKLISLGLIILGVIGLNLANGGQ